ncbi:mitochondrial ATP synthase epsilon chain-domain-containing protein [Cytidiella melzeri]|nr:mitochondrial ATP synthase epsilon chain-domain-containing protein [Cytidiella melzeri]
MSTTWRGTFTFNKYSQIAARALRQSLKETERVAAEKRGATILRYQEWKGGQGGQQVRLSHHCFPVILAMYFTSARWETRWLRPWCTCVAAVLG